MRSLLKFFRHTALLSALFVAIPVATAHHGTEPVDAMSEPFCEACLGALFSIPITLGTVGLVSGALLLLVFSGRPRTRR